MAAESKTNRNLRKWEKETVNIIIAMYRQRVRCMDVLCIPLIYRTFMHIAITNLLNVIDIM